MSIPFRLQESSIGAELDEPTAPSGDYGNSAIRLKSHLRVGPMPDLFNLLFDIVPALYLIKLRLLIGYL